jgi:predicted nucleic acid-binding protein
MAKSSRVLADAGVIVALVRPRDQWHQWTVKAATQLSPPFYTCEVVIAEACFLVRDLWPAQQRILGMLGDGFLKVEFSITPELERVNALMEKYSDLPMSLADSCLVRMSELYDDATVFTVDQDFLIYRKHGRKKIPLISPF